MGRLEIVEKLDRFLQRHNDLKEECEVVYLLVELRKLLDRDREQYKLNNYSLVRFHADWVVHTKKEYITSAMKEIMTKIDNSIDVYPKDGNINFLLLPEFRGELKQLLEKYDLPSEFIKNDGDWMKFILALTQVLVDQPLIKPTKNIAEFRYINMKKEGIMATIDFCGSKAGGSITLGFGI